MRFDDRLATVLGREPDRDEGRIAQWRQLLDILAQSTGIGDDAASHGRSRLADLRGRVPVEARREAVAAITGRALAPAIVALIADDVPPVMGALLSRLRLDDGEWLALLPRLTPTGRGFLRHRRDLGERVEAALAGFGASDFALDDGTSAAAEPVTAIAERLDEEPELPLPGLAHHIARAEPFEPEAGEGQIRAIISRIARFTSGREEAPAPAAPSANFRFETNAVGVLLWVEGVPRGPLVGETIAVPADGPYGVDAQAPGAFRRRTPFRDARLTVAGSGVAGGEWRIAGVPVFAPLDGRFLGYRGTARRPLRHENADARRSIVDPDTLRQLVHELRTPINAIGGFAEMIRRQMRGPVAEPYRARAGAIADEATRLMTAVDDLDISARLDGGRLGLRRGAIALAPLVDAVLAEHAERLPDGVPPPVRIGDAGLDATADAAALRRVVARLVSASLALALPGERIEAAIAATADDGAEIAVTRPARLAGLREKALLDPGFDARGDWPDAPLLGLGFSLHLVRRLAAAGDAALRIEPDRFVVRLARARDEADG